MSSCWRMVWKSIHSLSIHVHSSIIYSSQKVERKLSIIGEWINKMWYVHTMEPEKRNEIHTYYSVDEPGRHYAKWNINQKTIIHLGWVAQLIRPSSQYAKVVGSIPGQDTYKNQPALAGVAQCIEHGLRTKGLPVRFPVKAHAWVAGQVPGTGHVRGNHTLIILSSFSFSWPLSKNE